ncbi:MAG TPA: lysine-sensitive aspartokinase 3 [Spirochaetia bacterium]|nr:lysine-sensitive aspartokinase 3 [Spirochaetia bacterium]
MIVMKFGGTSVQNAEMMDATLSIAQGQIERAPVLVSSAMSKVTDQLQDIARRVGEGKEQDADTILSAILERHLTCARSFLTGANLSQCEADLRSVCGELSAIIKALALLKEWSKRSNDAILSFGERLSTIILLHRAHERGMQAELHDSRDLVKTDDNFTAAAPIEDLTARNVSTRVRTRPGLLAILQGFISSTVAGATTTLGRGGSDYTATIVGAALRAEEVQIWTDVTGIMTSDPRIVKGARTIDRISYREAAELAYFGAKVIHPATIQPAVNLGIPVWVKNTFRPQDAGTCIIPSAPGTGLKAIACKKGITLVNVSSSRMLLAYGFLRRIFEIFEKHQTAVDLIATSEVSVSVTIDNASSVNAIARDLSEIGTVGVENDKSIICLVGQDLWKDTAFVSRAFAALENIPVRMISLGSSDINLSLVVPVEATDEAVKILHQQFFPS